MVPIGSQTITSTSTPFNFANIPQTYQDLRLVISARGSNAAATFGMYGYLNEAAGTTNYSLTQLSGNGTAASSPRRSNVADFYFGELVGGTATAGIFSSVTVDFLNYANTTTFKTFLSRLANDVNGSGNTNVSAHLWRSTAGISTILCGMSGYVTMETGSTATLYGIRAVAS
jgi:hypothetical protein